MTSSGATQLVETIRRRVQYTRPSAWAGWKVAAETVWGPLLTLGALILIDQLARHGMPVLYPFPILLLTVVISAYLGGMRTALISAVLTVLYGVHFFAEPGLPLHYRPSGGYSLLAVGLIAPGIAVLVSRLRDEALRGTGGGTEPHRGGSASTGECPSCPRPARRSRPRSTTR